MFLTPWVSHCTTQRLTLMHMPTIASAMTYLDLINHHLLRSKEPLCC